MDETVSHDGQWAESLTEAIVGTVSEREDCDPLELPPLYESIDPDAVEAVMTDVTGEDVREEICLEFSYAGYKFAVDGGEVRIADE